MLLMIMCILDAAWFQFTCNPFDAPDTENCPIARSAPDASLAWHVAVAVKSAGPTPILPMTDSLFAGIVVPTPKFPLAVSVIACVNEMALPAVPEGAV